MTSPLLSVSNLKVSYGPVTVLHGVDLELHRGEIVSVIGANGAGKTTFLRAISQLIPATCGSIKFNDNLLDKKEAHELARLGLAHVPEGRQIFPLLSVRENLELGAYTRSNRTEIVESIEQVFELFPVLSQRSSQLGGTLSGGEQQMLALGRALMLRPKLLLLDEPSMGVAPIICARIFDALRKLNQNGISMLLVEQNAKAALKLATRAYLLELGHVIVSGPSAAMIDDARVKAAYLGE